MKPELHELLTTSNKVLYSSTHVKPLSLTPVPSVFIHFLRLFSSLLIGYETVINLCTFSRRKHAELGSPLQ